MLGRGRGRFEEAAASEEGAGADQGVGGAVRRAEEVEGAGGGCMVDPGR